MDAHDRPEGRETIEGGVVLRFPGDWVGPLEELVPFGPSAERHASPSESEPDFWGEDSAALHDAVEAPQRSAPRVPRRVPKRRALLTAGAVVAALLLGIAALLGSQSSTAPRVHGVTFETASIPPLAPSAPRTASRTIRRARHHVSATRARAHLKTTPTTPTSSTSSTSNTSNTPSSSPTAQPSHQPAVAPSNTGSSVPQSGGAFTLGGP